VTIRSVAALAALTVTLPADLALVGLALLRRRPPPATVTAAQRRTVLLTGGKMTKALQLARSFHLAGHRVVLVESPRYRWTGHRFSRAVDAFHCVPEPNDPAYGEALLEIAQREGVDVFVPVSSPAASVPDARAAALLQDRCDVVHAPAPLVARVDDKCLFTELAGELGLRVPDAHRITDPAQIEAFDFPEGREYILKRIAYNPVGRMDLTRLRHDTPERNAALARSLPISGADPWILQEFIEGTEYCTHSTVRDGRIRVYGCCESSAFQVNYAHVDHPEIHSWVTRFVGALGVTGQLSFDFIEDVDGHPYAIECNPRTHSAITMFHDHPDVANAYLDDEERPAIVPLPQSRPTYWVYHELWRLLTAPHRAVTVARLLRGQDAIFAWWDPLPYLMVHHLQIPSLLVDGLRRRKGWSRIDFNIGKLVEAGGD
jgi:hypothetical protein